MTDKMLTTQNGLFVWHGGYETKDLPKAAGFFWHGGNCRPGCKACSAGLGKVWWTSYPDKAVRLREYADDAAKAVLDKTASALEASLAEDVAADYPKPEGLSYLPYQKAGIAYALPRKNTLFADEMGCGKTIEALGVINADPTIKSVLVFCPGTARINWLREAQKWLTRKFNFLVISETGEVPPPEATFVIAAYDKVTGKKGEIVRQGLMAREWDVLICDESHLLKNPKAQRTTSMLGSEGTKKVPGVPGIVEKAKRRLFLSGTPMLNRPVELWPMLHALAPETFPNFFSFVKRYCAAFRSKWGWDFTGASNIEELQTRMRTSLMIRRMKKDVLKDLPPKTRQIIVLPPNGASEAVEAEAAAWKHHEEALKALHDDIELAKVAGDEEAYKKSVEALKEGMAVAFTQISEARHQVALAKVPYVIEHLECALESTNKVICFAHHKDVIDQIARHFPEGTVAVITGDTPMDQRQQAVDAFQKNPNVRLFIGSITAAGLAITLTASSTVIFAEIDWVPANVNQCEDRAHRIGAVNAVLVQHIVLDGSLDARIAETLVEKQEIADRLGNPEVLRVPALPTIKAKGNGEAKTTKTETPASKYPKATEEERKAAANVVQYLAGVCDGALSLDGHGFNKFDTKIGHEVAARSLKRPLTDGEVALVRRFAKIYRKQLNPAWLEVLSPKPADQPTA